MDREEYSDTLRALAHLADVALALLLSLLSVDIVWRRRAGPASQDCPQRSCRR